jgi:thioesterase domain-containing protein/acyl carrier protein
MKTDSNIVPQSIEGPGENSGSLGPRDEIEKQLVEIWKQLLEQPNIGVRDDFFDLGGDSILGTHLMVAIEKKFGQRIELSRLFSCPTVELLAQELRGARKPEFNYIVPMHPEGNQTPLFCVHCATGHVLRYRALASHLDPDMPIYGLRSPNMQQYAKLPTVEDLANLYLEEIRKVQPHGPYQICGFSFGGTVAFEIARVLNHQGEPVSVLALLDDFNPAFYKNLSVLNTVRFRSTYLFDRLGKYARRIFRGDWKELSSVVRERISWRKKEMLWKLHGKQAPPQKAAEPEEIRDSVIMFSDIGWAYTPKPFPGRVFLFCAEGREPEYGIDPTYGWAGVAGGGVELVKLPGDHYAMLEEPGVQGLAKALGACLVQNTPRK